MKEQEVGFTTVSGRRVDIADLRPADISIWDIAHALSRQCRYAGHIRGFYSVAEHSVIVSRIATQLARSEKRGEELETYQRMLGRFGLLHDAHEAYIGDTIGPLKRLLRARDVLLIDVLEKQIDEVIRARFDLADAFSDEVARVVKAADKQALLFEQTELRLIDSAAHRNHVERDDLTVLTRRPVTNNAGTCPVGLRPNRAKRLFLNEFRLLRF